MAARAQVLGIRTAVGLQTRSALVVRYVRDLIPEGYVGEVRSPPFTLDILTTTLGTPTLSILLNQGRGQFSPCQAYPCALTVTITHLTVTDFDRDGRPDGLSSI